MKFLSNEWFDAMISNAKRIFTKSGKLSISYCEVYNNCPDGETKWLYLVVTNSIITEIYHGSGETPAADYVGRGEYADHVKICKGELDPKKAVMSGIFKIEENIKPNALRTVQLISMYTKMVEAKNVPGVEY